MLGELVHWLVDTIGTLGYPGIVVLMALESSFFPFPSEVVMVPAGYLAQQGQMDIVTVVVMGIMGSLLGALVNYYIAVTVGRASLLKWGHLIGLSDNKFKEMEQFLKRHGVIGTFIGRLIPGLRQYISFPAGLVHMPLTLFCLFTGLGAGLWVTVLAVIGYQVGENEELVAEWSKTALFWVLLGSALLIAIYWKWTHSRR